jgi:hypothetical protein
MDVAVLDPQAALLVAVEGPGVEDHYILLLSLPAKLVVLHEVIPEYLYLEVRRLCRPCCDRSVPMSRPS